MKQTLTEKDYQEAARMLGCEVAAIKAVAEVESSGDGFLPSGEPKILFERHKFSEFTKGKYDLNFPDISNKKPGGYVGGQAEHRRLQVAVKLDRTAALMATSWGKFQIMGFNYKEAGYKDLQTFINAAYNSEADHLLMFVNFIKSKNLAKYLINKDWAGFAYRYNGAGYKVNRYDEKMLAAYRKYSK